MARSCIVWAAAILTVALACLARPQVRAADGPGSAVLKKHGLKIAGSLAVVDEEAEIKTKLAEARRLSKQLSLLPHATTGDDEPRGACKKPSRRSPTRSTSSGPR